MKVLRTSERILLVVGLGLLVFCAVAYLTGLVQSRMSLKRFERELNQPDVHKQRSSDTAFRTVAKTNFSLWSEKRIRDYEVSLAEHFQAPVAILRIERIGLEVPVFDGTDELTLNRGVGRVIGTSQPGESGNIAIAGHRDGFFRVLKDAQLGDAVQLVTRDGTRTYVTDSIRIVDRDEIDVLRTGQSPSITLITCYPFYYVGSAPKRYIVHASMQSADTLQASSAVQISPTTNTATKKENTR